MKRDLDLIRNILFYLEEDTSGQVHPTDLVSLSVPVEPPSDSSDEQINDYELECAVYKGELDRVIYHIKLLIDAAYIEAIDVSTLSESSFIITRITMNGHDYIDSIRNNKIWDNVKKSLSDVSGSAALEVIKALAMKFISAQLGL